MAADELIDPARVQPSPPKKHRRPKRSSRPSVGLIPKNFLVDIDDERIRAIADELKNLRLEYFENAAAITFRSLLDMAVTRYLNELGELERLIESKSAKQPRSSDWVPTLHQQLDHILKTKEIPLNPEARKAIQKFISDTNKSLTLDAMNWFTHNRYVPPTEQQLRSFWTMLKPLFELTLQEPNDPPVKRGTK